MAFSEILNPGGLRIPADYTGQPLRPTPPVVSQRMRRRAGWRRSGTIIARTWPAGFDEQEYRLLLVGGHAARLAAPDRLARDGQPVFYLTGYERRQRERLLDRLCLDRHAQHNIACNAGRTALLNYVANVGGLTGVQYFAVGTGSPPAGQAGPAATDTALFSEFFRKQFSTATVTGNQVDVSTVFQGTEGNTTYTEAGIFGDGATGTAGSGQLFAHALYAYTKQSGVLLSNDYLVFFN